MTSARSYYSFEFGTRFWNFLVKKAEEERVASIDKVLDEINKGDDELKIWANKQFKEYFFSTKNVEVFDKYAEVVKWSESMKDHYNRQAIDEFMKEDNADPWLIAFALTKQPYPEIVTFEKYNQDKKIEIPIPNVCKKFDIKWCNLFEMMRRLKFNFNDWNEVE